MKNNLVFTNHVEGLILSEKLPQAGTLLLSFFKQYKDPSAAAKDLQKQVVLHVNNLNDLNNRVLQNTINETEVAQIEKNIWIGFQQINGQIRELKDINFDFSDEKMPEYMATYEPKPETWHHAGWLPLLVAGLIVAVAFSIGLNYNSKRIKAQKTAEQAAIDAKNGVIRSNAEGALLLKLVEEKTITDANGFTMTVKSVNGTEANLELKVAIQHKTKAKIKNLKFILIDSSQKGKEINAEENTKNSVEIITVDTALNEQTIHFNYAVGDQRALLLNATFLTTISNADVSKSIAIAFLLK
jgi:hypothetical protein